MIEVGIPPPSPVATLSGQHVGSKRVEGTLRPRPPITPMQVQAVKTHQL